MATSHIMTEATNHQAIGESQATANRSMLLDEIWQDFGYRKRPKYGAIVQKWRRQWKVELEKAILREIFVSTIALFVLAKKIKLADVPSVIEFVDEVMDRDLANEFYFSPLGYTSRDEAVADAVNMAEEYCREDSKRWASIWIRRLAVGKIPNDKVKARILAGCVKHAVTMPVVLRVIADTSNEQ
jgi:hypothetical protein